MTEPVLSGVHEVKSESHARWRYRAALRICCLSMLAMLVPLRVLAGDISGSYVGGGKDFTVLLQILPAGQGRVVGRLRTTSLDERGKLRIYDRPLSGAANGESFVGKLEASWDNGGDVAISGNLDDGYLLISAANGLRVALRQGEEAQFNRAVEQLGQQGTSIQQQAVLGEAKRKSERALAETARQISDLQQRISVFSKVEPRRVEAQAIAAQRYGVFTQRMKEKFMQLQITTQQTGEAEGNRTILGADMKNLGIDAANVHVDVRNAQSDFESQAARLLKSVGAADNACHQVTSPGVDDTALRKTCALMPSATMTLNQTVKGVGDGYSILENAWVAQRAEQEGLVASAREFLRQHAFRR
jgi:hypothetical protein